MTDLEQELTKLFGNNFFQIAFYRDNRPVQATGAGRCWVKVEAELDENTYKAWQVRGVASFAEAYAQIIGKIRHDLIDLPAMTRVKIEP